MRCICPATSGFSRSGCRHPGSPRLTAPLAGRLEKPKHDCVPAWLWVATFATCRPLCLRGASPHNSTEVTGKFAPGQERRTTSGLALLSLRESARTAMASGCELHETDPIRAVMSRLQSPPSPFPPTATDWNRVGNEKYHCMYDRTNQGTIFRGRARKIGPSSAFAAWLRK